MLNAVAKARSLILASLTLKNFESKKETALQLPRYLVDRNVTVKYATRTLELFVRHPSIANDLSQMLELKKTVAQRRDHRCNEAHRRRAIPTQSVSRYPPVLEMKNCKRRLHAVRWYVNRFPRYDQVAGIHQLLEGIQVGDAAALNRLRDLLRQKTWTDAEATEVDGILGKGVDISEILSVRNSRT